MSESLTKKPDSASVFKRTGSENMFTSGIHQSPNTTTVLSAASWPALSISDLNSFFC